MSLRVFRITALIVRIVGSIENARFISSCKSDRTDERSPSFSISVARSTIRCASHARSSAGRSLGKA
jgi:hypothetical protein